MPLLFIISLAAQIICCVHAIKTGRNQTWIWFIIIAPGLGSFVYFIMEILPDLMGSNSAHKVKKSAVRALDPTREYRQAKNDLAYLDSTENRLRLAAAAVGIGDFEEACAAYERCLEGPYANDPAIRLKLATARYLSGNGLEAIVQLDLIQEKNNGFHSQEGHFIYAQSLEKLGRYDEAVTCYEDLVVYATGEEARARFGMLLSNLGQSEKAREQFNLIIENVDHSPKYYKKMEAEWYRLAKYNS